MKGELEFSRVEGAIVPLCRQRGMRESMVIVHGVSRERGQSTSVKNLAHLAEMKNCGMILRKFTLAIVKKNWVWGRDRKGGAWENMQFPNS